MKVFITVREHEFYEDGYIVDKVFTDYKEAQESLLQKGFRILDEGEELYLNEGGKMDTNMHVSIIELYETI